MEDRLHHNILDVFAEEKAKEHGFLRASAPMVRYSKLEFRKLLRQHCVRLCFTPMIIADSFNNSQKARENEFTTTADDQPIIAQFAASSVDEFNISAQLIYPYVDGIDLNCGCPQSWAIGKGYGCGLLRKPELVHDIVRTVRRSLPTDFSISVKLRLLSNESTASTIDFVRQLEKCGVTFITIHGRTSWQRSSDTLNVEAMADIKKSIQIPLIVNGNVRSWQDACDLYTRTKADGVMAARGLLSNPTLFNPNYKDYSSTPKECVKQWLDIAVRAGDNLQIQCFQHHLTFMYSSQINRKLRHKFNSFFTKTEIFKFFEEYYDLRPSMDALVSPFTYTNCDYRHWEVPQHLQKTKRTQNNQWHPKCDGKYFNEFNVTIRKWDVIEDIGLQDTFFLKLSNDDLY